jgi:subtilisin family serine protease
VGWINFVKLVFYGKVSKLDTGVDYRHPALGGGFGPGFKIAGSCSFVFDNGTLQDGPNPLVTCYGGGHGTHVSGNLTRFRKLD